MSTKQEVADQLTALGIPFDPSATKAVLDALLAGHEDPTAAAAAQAAAQKDAADKAAADAKANAVAEAAKATADQSEVEVGDPLILRPIDLPLVVKPAGGGAWKNDEQVKFAATLNAFAYSQPKKWQVRKGKLVAQLIEIGTNPDLYYVLSGEPRAEDNVRFEVKDTRVQK